MSHSPAVMEEKKRKIKTPFVSYALHLKHILYKENIID